MSTAHEVAPTPPAGSVPELRRELTVRDISLFSIACMVSVRWISTAAHAGPGSILLWVAAALFFLIPLAIAVGTLTVKYPGAGGMYVWTRNDFGPFHGFLCFWTYWLGIAALFSGLAIAYTSISAYALGPRLSYLADDRRYVLGLALVAIWLGLVLNMVGITVGKWTENAGGFASWLLVALLVAVAAVVYHRRGSATPIHAAQLVPHLSWGLVNFWASICYAVSGFECAGMMGGEVRDPARTMPRAAWISSVFITAFYIASTLALMIVMQPEAINELSGVPQAAAVAGGVLGAPYLPLLIVAIVLAAAVGQFGGMGAATSRLPFAAGVDRLLPAMFARLHPRWGTPYLSILALGIFSTALLVISQLGDTMRAGYESLVSLMVIAGFLPYFYVFASAWKAGRRWSALSGGAVTALAIVCSIVPGGEITHVWLFESKIGLGTAAIIGSAWLLYRRALRSRRETARVSMR